MRLLFEAIKERRGLFLQHCEKGVLRVKWINTNKQVVGLAVMNDIMELLATGDELTSRQIAEQLKKTGRDVIDGLLELERGRRVVQRNGYWCRAQEMNSCRVPPVNVLKVVREWGAISATEIAFITGGRLSGITTALAGYLQDKEIICYRKNGVYVYSLAPVVQLCDGSL